MPLLAQFPHSPVDPDRRDRGAAIYAGKCASCHGDDARGTANGPDLIRSLPVLHDRREMLYGKELGPLLTTLPGHSYKFNDKQLGDLSQFLTASINGILRSGGNSQPTGLLNGDAQAGEAYFNGAGGCTKCHSVTGDLAGIGKKYSASALQQKFLFPNSGLFLKKKVQVTVKLRSGKTYTGDVVHIDDFTVMLREKSGETLSFNRVPGITVTTDNPYTAHEELLRKYTNADMHNMTTYLDSLK
ncbi:MAG: c-type cytochrome [Edaphobacter sp.]|uniref:c-type cytochrome n=1 Tax=Edaphobacter sp. TaxID=1934404 RepID=UPI0023955708|nr:c-type cytochrome [Edaphobacter sp.]MDE1177908.1 c-type cytochrome [Edaphobacter sp.]